MKEPFQPPNDNAAPSSPRLRTNALHKLKKKTKLKGGKDKTKSVETPLTKSSSVEQFSCRRTRTNTGSHDMNSNATIRKEREWQSANTTNTNTEQPNSARNVQRNLPPPRPIASSGPVSRIRSGTVASTSPSDINARSQLPSNRQLGGPPRPPPRAPQDQPNVMGYSRPVAPNRYARGQV